MIPQNPQLKELFANIDVDDIIETVTGKKMVKAIDAEFNAPKVEDVSPEPDDNSKLGTESFAKTTAEGKGDEIISEEKEEFQNSTKEQEEGAIRGLNIQRYKGLGEMNAEQLWETTMDPQKRTLKLIAIEDAKEADRLFDILMGEEVEPRKHFIQSQAVTVKNLDV